MGYRIAVDTGGTFSDVVLIDERGGFSLQQGADHARTASSTASPSALGYVADERGLALERAARRHRRPDLRDDALDERDPHAGARRAPRCSTTEGFGDTLVLPRGRQAAPVRLPRSPIPSRTSRGG